MNEKIIKLQSIWRGYNARKKLLHTRTEYESIFNEIENCGEQNDSIINWPNEYLCYPVFNKGNVKASDKSENNTFDLDSLEDIDGNSNSNNQTDCIISTDAVICTNCSNSESSVVNCSCTKGPEERDTVVEFMSKNIQTDPPFSDISCQTSLCFEHNGNLVSSTPRTVLESNNLKTHEFATNEIDMKKTDNGGNRNSPDRPSCSPPPPVSPTHTSEMDLTNSSAKELFVMKEELSLELLWLNQAITSRKTYLKMKQNTS